MTPIDSARLESTIAAVDAANTEDPNHHGDEPLARVQGQSASRWLAQLVPDPGVELQLAVRAHHLRRWEIRRSDYPDGRAGYLRWRRENKAHQAESLGDLMHADGWPTDSIDRAQTLLARGNLRSDPDVQALEDAACLVFLETQFDDMAARTEHDHLVSIVAKTLKKMSAGAVTLASSIGLSPTAQAVVAEAVTLLGEEDSQ